MNDTTRIISLSDVSELVSLSHSMECGRGSDGKWNVTLSFGDDCCKPDTAELIARQLKDIFHTLHRGDVECSEGI